MATPQAPPEEGISKLKLGGQSEADAAQGPEGIVTAREEAGAGAEEIHDLPPAPAGLAGESTNKGKHYTVTVSNKAGYLCHVHVVAEWPVGPSVPFAIFTHPDNSRLFRDIQRVGTRNVVKTEPCYKEVQVEQLGEIQVLWMRRTYSTWLSVVEDTRDPECLQTEFHLLKSDVLAKFSGKWEFRPVHDASGEVVGCRGELHQDVLPKGMPTFMTRLPVLGGALRGISVRAVTRIMDDMNVVLDKVRAGHAAGRATEAILRDLCGSVAEAAHSNGAVASFAFAPDDEDDEEDEEESDAAAAAGATEASEPASAADLQDLAQQAGEKSPSVDVVSSYPGEATATGTVHVVAEATSA